MLGYRGTSDRGSRTASVPTDVVRFAMGAGRDLAEFNPPCLLRTVHARNHSHCSVARCMLGGSGMTSPPSGELRVLRGGGVRVGGGPIARLMPGFVSLGVAMAFAIGVASGSWKRGGVAALPDDQRVALYARTIEELREFCGERRPDALRDHCRELASFAEKFTECRIDCRALARQQLVQEPTR